MIDWLKVPHVAYREQAEIIRKWLPHDRGGYGYIDRIAAVRRDSTGGTGDAQNEMLRDVAGLPIGNESFYQFTFQSKDRLYVNFEEALFRNSNDDYTFSYSADHPLTAEFENQMTQLVKEYKGDGEYLSVHHPDEQGAKDDARIRRL